LAQSSSVPVIGDASRSGSGAAGPPSRPASGEDLADSGRPAERPVSVSDDQG